MKKIIFKVIIISLIANSCSRKLHPNYKSVSEINATIINLKTENRKFIPAHNSNDLIVRANMVFFLNENGNGNFNGKNDEDNESLQIIYSKINTLITNLKNPNDSVCYTGTDFLASSKMQYQFRNIYIKDTFARNYLNAAKGYSEKGRNISAMTPSKNWWLASIDNAINDTIKQKGINIYNTMNVNAYKDLILNNSEKGYLDTRGFAVSQFPDHSNFNRSSQLNYPNKYTKRLWIEKFYIKKHKRPYRDVRRLFVIAHRGLAHELGHSVGLHHANKYHGRNKCKNALMNQSGDSKRNYIQPTEIGKIHKTLMTSNVMQFVTDASHYNVPLLIAENENWSFKKIRFYQDIVVQKGKILILNNTVILPNNASITLEKNALLVLNNVNLLKVNGEKFTNFIEKKHAKITRY